MPANGDRQNIETPVTADNQAQIAVAQALHGLLYSKPEALTESIRLFDAVLPEAERRVAKSRPEEASALARLVAALAIAHDLNRRERDEAARHAVSARLLKLGRTLSARHLAACRPTPVPVLATLPQAAAGLCALTAYSDPKLKAEAEALNRLVLNTLRRMLANLGPNSWPPDGVDALRQALGDGLGAYCYAYKRIARETLLEHNEARRWGSLLCILALPPRKGAANPEVDSLRLGFLPPLNEIDPRPRWAPLNAISGDLPCLLSLADAGSRAALLWSYQTCYGTGPGDSLGIAKGMDALPVLLGAYLDESSLRPEYTLARTWSDAGAGLLLMRRTWDNADDCLAAFTANASPSPLIASAADAGSFRLVGLGGQWAVQRERDQMDLQAPARERENIVFIPGTHGWLGGKVEQLRTHPDGSGSLAVNLDAACTVAPPPGQGPKLVNTLDIGIRARRVLAVDYSGRCGSPILFAVVDEIQKAPPRRWLMHTREKNVKLLRDGFELRAENGATLRATVITPSQPRISLQQGRWTDTLAIDGDEQFFVVMTIQPAGQAAPRVQKRGEGLTAELRIGETSLRYDGRDIANH